MLTRRFFPIGLMLALSLSIAGCEAPRPPGAAAARPSVGSDMHIPPFARAPYQAFSRETAVTSTAPVSGPEYRTDHWPPFVFDILQRKVMGTCLHVLISWNILEACTGYGVEPQSRIANIVEIRAVTSEEIMTAKTQTVFEAAMALPEPERLLLVERLLEKMDR